jgi:hypothetical protein
LPPEAKVQPSKIKLSNALCVNYGYAEPYVAALLGLATGLHFSEACSGTITVKSLKEIS